MRLREWRQSKHLTLQALASRVGLASKGRMSRIERGRERCPTDLAIAIDRATNGAVTIADVRPDLRDVHITREQCSA